MSNIEIKQSIQAARELLGKEKGLSPAFRAAMSVMFVAVSILLERLNLNSKNSSNPPSSDPNREKKKRKSSGLKRGGQQGHVGTTLKQVDDADEIEEILIDRSTLPAKSFTHVGFERRQVVDIDIRRVVTEYRAEVLKDENGKRYVAPFPEGVTRPVQYGNGIKAHAVYLSYFQLLPYARIEDYFRDQLQIPISSGTICNFNQDASKRLEPFETWLTGALTKSSVLHADETGINVDGKRHWLHCNSNRSLTYYYPHTKRGKEAMDEMGVLPHFSGVLCHDHWKPYYRYECSHALCNAHHLRELERAWEQDKQQWAKQMQKLLCEMNDAVHDAGGSLPTEAGDAFRKRYRALLLEADTECPPPDDGKRKGQRGRLKRSKSRNLLERLRDFEDDVLRFMDMPEVPFTNNQGENDLRMTKVQQKISGCFRSIDGATAFCRCRSYLSTCRKQGLSSSEALRLLFEGDNPAFMMDAE
ncbi:IS66 family transposase [Shewanella vesiculosa]|uniref:IS66 family transposase n=1 Tax=Shewanella vesiculosa TaxID=518738 RepID=UPI0023592A43|nr:IS66 family transposase [Shewanella vesiculosa]NCP76517.1 IS66 family transposase [Shewanella vesiculosa]